MDLSSDQMYRAAPGQPGISRYATILCQKLLQSAIGIDFSYGYAERLPILCFLEKNFRSILQETADEMAEMFRTQGI